MPEAGQGNGRVLTAREGAVAVITLDRPDKLNAITPQMTAALGRALDDIEGDDRVRAIVIEGAGRAFSAGFDLEAGDWDSLANIRREMETDFDLIMRFWDCPKPTVAALHGYCLGGALELALACDMAVASVDTRLGEPEVRFGSGIVALLLPWITGPKQAKELLLTGNDRITAQRALEMGLVNRVVPEGQHRAAALELAREVAANDAAAVQLTKLAINRSYEVMGLRQALAQALELGIAAEASETEDSRTFNQILAKQGAKAALAWRAKQTAASED
jgi:enoyl-CoA hydratase